MAAIARFFWVQLRTGGPRHIVVTKRTRNPVEGDKTRCGLFVRPHQSWWLLRPGRSSEPKCRRCYR